MPLDRLAHRRADADWIAAAWADPAAQVIACAKDRIAVDAEGGGRRLARIGGADPGAALFLGSLDGAPVFAVDLGAEAGGADLAPLLPALPRLDDDDAELAAFACGLANWHRTHGHCARCGAPSQPARAGSMRVCTACGAEHYPRTDPVVQVLPHDGERCVLGRSPQWPPVFFSVLAGFVEPGETPEAAARRELEEETGLRATGLTPGGAQPWPMPHQLLIGFTAVCDDVGGAVAADDLAEIRILTRDELTAAKERKEILFPPRRALAGTLIRGWLGDRA